MDSECKCLPTLNPQSSAIFSIQLKNIDFLFACAMKMGERWKSESCERALKLDENAGTEQIIKYYIRKKKIVVHNKGRTINGL